MAVATGAVGVPGDTRVGCRTMTRVMGPREVEGQESKGEESGAGPALGCIFFCPCSCLSLLLYFFLSFVWDEGDQGALV